MGFPCSSAGKESACNMGGLGSIPGLGRSFTEGNGYPLQYSEAWVQSLGWEDPHRRERLPTSVFLPGEFNGLHSPWGHKESDTTERLSLSLFFYEGVLSL